VSRYLSVEECLISWTVLVMILVTVATILFVTSELACEAGSASPRWAPVLDANGNFVHGAREHK